VTAAVICACRAAAASASAILKETKNRGLELAKAAATAERKNEKPKDYLTRWRNGDTVAGVRLNNNTAITYKANEEFVLENWMAKLWLE
jgi:hypothetical protein